MWPVFGARLIREGCGEAKRMTGWIEKDEVVPGCRLRLRPDGTEGDRALLRPYAPR